MIDTRLDRVRLHEQIEASLRGAIRSGEYPVGSKLPSERALMSMFNVGRPAVKEALLMLERKGFVKLQRGVAPVIMEPTPEGAMDAIEDMVAAMLADSERRGEFYDFRVILEVSAAMDAARGADRSTVIDLLNDALDASVTAAGDIDAFRTADMAFHRALMSSTGNAVAGAFHDALLRWGLFNPEKLASDGPQARRIHARVIAQHRAIVEAVRMGDALAAAQAVREHLATRRDAADVND